jgi:hypothetical protein
MKQKKYWLIAAILFFSHNVWEMSYAQTKRLCQTEKKITAAQVLEKLTLCIILFTNASNSLSDAARKQFLDGAYALYTELIKIEKELPHLLTIAMSEKLSALGAGILKLLGFRASKITFQQKLSVSKT